MPKINQGHLIIKEFLYTKYKPCLFGKRFLLDQELTANDQHVQNNFGSSQNKGIKQITAGDEKTKYKV